MNELAKQIRRGFEKKTGHKPVETIKYLDYLESLPGKMLVVIDEYIKDMEKKYPVEYSAPYSMQEDSYFVRNKAEELKSEIKKILGVK